MLDRPLPTTGRPGRRLPGFLAGQGRRTLIVACGLALIAAGLALLEFRLLGVGTAAWAAGLACVA